MTIGLKKRCLHNPGLDCPVDLDCPLNSEQFKDAIERWMYAGRTPRALSIKPTQSSPRYDYGSDIIEKANVANWFKDHDAVIDYFLVGGMTWRVCEELRRGFEAFKRERWAAYKRRERRKQKIPKC